MAQLAGALFQNSGTLEASGSGGLVIEGTVLNTGGTIEALAGSHVDLANGEVIAGGTVATAAATGGGTAGPPVAGGLIETVAGSATLGVNGLNVALNNAGQVVVTDNTTLTLAATNVDNTGTVALEAAGNATRLVMGGSVTVFQGGGTITLSDDSHNAIVGNGQSGQELINGDNTISGARTLGAGSLSFQNQALIDATGTNALIIVGGSSGTGTAGSTFGNSGTLEASGSGGLLIERTVLNAQGTVQALAGSHVDLANGVVIAGGTIATAAGTVTGGGTGGAVTTVPGGIIDTVAGSAALGAGGQNVNVNNAGQLVVNDDATLMLAASTVNNSGTVALKAAGHATDLVMGGGVTQF